MIVVKWVAFGFGVLVLLAVWGSIVKTLVLPRGQTSRLGVFVGRRIVMRGFLWLAGRFDDYESKDRVLALSAPTSLLTLLVTWLIVLVLGFALMLWPLVDGGFLEALRESGSSVFTLGFAAVPAPAATMVYFLAALSGLIVIALLIGYLPVIYSAFQRRETLVTMLQTRAGSPAWGPEILARAQLVGLMESLRGLYAEWEVWAADVAESHSSYPVLVWFRSPHALRSWVVGLLAVMDSAAIYQSFAPSMAPTEARLVIRMGFTCLRYIAVVIGIPFDPDPYPDDPIQLTKEEFLGGVKRLEEIGFPMERTPEEAWEHFRGWRVNYEALAYAFADMTTAPPGPWSGPRAHLPGMAIIPERPPNRRPEDPTDSDRPKVDGFRHLA